jgi:hypothetical protein
MHSEGNFHFYDPVSKILFTGDLGVSMMSGKEAGVAANIARHRSSEGPHPADGRLSPPLHGVQQDPARLWAEPHGAPAGHSMAMLVPSTAPPSGAARPSTTSLTGSKPDVRRGPV